MEESYPSSNNYAVQVQKLSKSFGNRFALKGIDVKINQGESVVIFGHNGAGKSTLLKIIATIINPTSGSIQINGLNIKDNAEEIRRRIGVVGHNTFLYSNLTVYENLEFYCRMYDVPERHERIREIVATVGMTYRIYDRVGTLSRGMQQRLAIARSLIHRPSIMLLDEPETGLDYQATSTLWETVRAGEGEKRTILLTSHSLERGLELGDHFLILNQGKVVYEKSGKTANLTDLKQAYENSARTKL